MISAQEQQQGLQGQTFSRSGEFKSHPGEGLYFDQPSARPGIQGKGVIQNVLRAAANKRLCTDDSLPLGCDLVCLHFGRLFKGYPESVGTYLLIRAPVERSSRFRPPNASWQLESVYMR
jgi:hypothetical protein